ncbi:MAG TPA: RNA methyltransferase, partial [Thermomicrobiales bacterium]|nr:RNA methyltransferase [Thermomicrobiales bacterium]
RLEAVIIDPTRLRSDVAKETIAGASDLIEHYVTLTASEFERISSRDNPVGIAAIVRWRPLSLESLLPEADGLYLVADDVRDPGNLGTLIRATDAAGGAAVIVRGGAGPSHPGALRASLGTTFELPVAVAGTIDDVFTWAVQRGVQTIATSARASVDLWDFDERFPLAILVGNEGEGLPDETTRRCDACVRIPMRGTATSLNVSVAAGIVLFELARRGQA